MADRGFHGYPATPARRREMLGAVYRGRGWGKSRFRLRRRLCYGLGLKLAQNARIGDVHNGTQCESESQCDNYENSYKTRWAFLAKGGDLERRLTALIAVDANAVVMTKLAQIQLIQKQARCVPTVEPHHGEIIRMDVGAEKRKRPDVVSNCNRADRTELIDGANDLTPATLENPASLPLCQTPDGVGMLLAACDFDCHGSPDRR